MYRSSNKSFSFTSLTSSFISSFSYYFPSSFNYSSIFLCITEVFDLLKLFISEKMFVALVFDLESFFFFFMALFFSLRNSFNRYRSWLLCWRFFNFNLCRLLVKLKIFSYILFLSDLIFLTYLFSVFFLAISSIWTSFIFHFLSSRSIANFSSMYLSLWSFLSFLIYFSSFLVTIVTVGATYFPWVFSYSENHFWKSSMVKEYSFLIYIYITIQSRIWLFT